MEKFEQQHQMPVLRIINPENISKETAESFKSRNAARGVIFDNKNNVAVLPVSNHAYYKLPGGGIEEGENRNDAFRRECLEEIGFDVEVICEIGSIVEYRNKISLLQTSYCYMGKVIGERKETHFTEHELSQGFKEPQWVSFDEAYRLISTSAPNNWEGEFIKERDTLILEEARKLIK